MTSGYEINKFSVMSETFESLKATIQEAKKRQLIQSTPVV